MTKWTISKHTYSCENRCYQCKANISKEEPVFIFNPVGGSYSYCSLECIRSRAEVRALAEGQDYVITNLNEFAKTELKPVPEKETVMTVMAVKKIYSTVVVTRDKDGELATVGKRVLSVAESANKAILARSVTEGEGVEILGSATGYAPLSD